MHDPAVTFYVVAIGSCGRGLCASAGADRNFEKGASRKTKSTLTPQAMIMSRMIIMFACQSQAMSDQDSHRIRGLTRLNRGHRELPVYKGDRGDWSAIGEDE